MKKASTENVLIAVRAYCIECSGGSRRAVDECNRQACPLYPYRNRKASDACASPAKPVQLAGQMSINDICGYEGGRKVWVH